MQAGGDSGTASARGTLLLVDDEEHILSSLKRMLRRDGYQILTAPGGAEGLRILREQPVDVIVSDQRMPHMTGVEFLRQAREICPDAIRIVLSGYTELQSIIDAVNEGAVYKFLTKPWEDDLLRQHIQDAVRQKFLADDNDRLSRELESVNAALRAANADLERLLSQSVRRLASDETVLGINQEILDSLPLPLVGVDDQDLMVYANRRAVDLLTRCGCGIGTFVAQCLPADLLDLLHHPESGPRPWGCLGRRFSVSCYRMGAASSSSGRVLVWLPEGLDIPLGL